jgi:hypothetical protein
MAKGIFCLEGFWGDIIRDKSSVLPVLELLEKKEKTATFYHRCRTAEELEFFLNKWTQPSVKKKYPVLYLSFHGKSEGLQLSPTEIYELDRLAEFLEGKCERSVIFFASCETLNNRKSVFDSFLSKTNVLAVMGYCDIVDWYKATAFELLLLRQISSDEMNFDSKGFEKFYSTFPQDYAKLHRDLHFRAWYNPKVTRKRVTKKVMTV